MSWLKKLKAVHTASALPYEGQKSARTHGPLGAAAVDGEGVTLPDLAADVRGLRLIRTGLYV